ncbi:MAG: magnesium transporter MgtE N-terminal domain-containing protein, partial [Planctomycetota bacterium]
MAERPMRAYTALVLPELKEFLSLRDQALVRATVDDLLAADLADICEHLEPTQAAELLTLLPLALSTETLQALDGDLQVVMIRELGRARLVPLLDEMNPDDRADLMKLVPAATREALLPLMAQVERNDLRKLLSYPEETAGALMTTEYVWLKRELTAEDALQKLRHVAPDSEMIYYVYVVDQERRLQGVCSLRDIICAMPGTKLGELMREHPVTVP